MGEESKRQNINKDKQEKNPSKTSRQTNKETYVSSIYEQILISNLYVTDSLKVDFT